MSPVPPAANTTIVELTAKNILSSTGAKELYERIWQANTASPPGEQVSGQEDVLKLVDKFGLKQVSDAGELEKLVDDFIAANPDKVGDAKANPKAIGWFVGQVMKASGGKANPQAVNDILKKKLGS